MPSTTALRLLPLADDPRHLEEAVRLYLSAFPPAERRTGDDWRRQLARGGAFRAEAIVREEAFAGFISHWQLGEFLYVEHFAVCPQARGGGIGGQAIDRLCGGPLPVVLEVEPPVTETARRRIGFYRRHGLHLSDRPYLQPPYRAGEDWLPLRLMCNRPDFLARRFNDVRTAIYRQAYGVENAECAAPPSPQQDHDACPRQNGVQPEY